MKTDSNKFNGFESILPPIIEDDIHLRVNVHQRIMARERRPTIFQPFLSDRVALIQISGSFELGFAELTLKDPFYRGYVVECRCALNSNAETIKLAAFLEQAVARRAVVVLLLRESRAIAESSTVLKLKSRGVIVADNVTRSAALMKLAFLLGRVD